MNRVVRFLSALSITSFLVVVPFRGPELWRNSQHGHSPSALVHLALLCAAVLWTALIVTIAYEVLFQWRTGRSHELGGIAAVASAILTVLVLWGGPSGAANPPTSVTHSAVVLSHPLHHSFREQLRSDITPPGHHGLFSIFLLGRRGTNTGRPKVHLLRSYPEVDNLTRDFVPALRRRSVEMTAYLSVHAGEAVTGDRLRSRVLNDGESDVDASVRTLANTATSVRRALGSSHGRPRLRRVGSQGLYYLDDVDSDVAEFFNHVGRAKAHAGDEASLREALALIHSEVLAATLRGFEWFVHEGHLAKVQRFAEWAALELHDLAMGRGDCDEAAWALGQGLLADPYSEPLRQAAAAVPRLSELRGDRSRGSQDQTVGAGRPEAVRGALARFTNQVPE
ncbi:MAG: hypothetical protein WCJ82_05650 [Actinomycetota bacterium]